MAAATTSKRRKRRIRSPHPGVVIKRRTLPSGATAYRARYTDPDTGREVYVTLDPLEVPTAEARRQWAIDKAHDIVRRKMDRAAGRVPEAPPEPKPEPKRTTISEAIEAYTNDAKPLLKERTLVTYSLAIANLEAWARDRGIENLDELTRARLVDLRGYLVSLPKRRGAAGKGSGRGAQKVVAPRRGAQSINRDLRTLKTVLGHWRKCELLTGLTRDDISDALEAAPVQLEAPEFYAPPALRKILEAAMRHDAETFAETRDEHAGKRPRGSTARYEPIAPFVAFLMLTGCRRSEALAIEWRMADLDALDHDGRKVGEIRLPAAITKTGRARTIGLEVSPALRKILAALRLRDGSEGFIFGGAKGYTGDLVETARRRLVREYGAPSFSPQGLRSTCSSFLTSSQGIFGAATVFLSARQLGHSVQVAEKHYLNAIRGVPKDARTLEAAMQIEKELADLLGSIVTAPRKARAK